MKYSLLIALLTTLPACDTFRALDSVARPGGSDSSRDGALDAPDDRDADMPPTPDMPPAVIPDLPVLPDLPPNDIGPDVPPDLGPDLSGPQACPSARPGVPSWASSGSVSVADVPFDARLPLSGVAIAASAHGAATPQFVIGYQWSDAGSAALQVASWKPPQAIDSRRLGHATAAPFRGVAVARRPNGDFGVLTVAESPGCMVSNIQAVAFTLAGGGAFNQVDLATINEACGRFRPIPGLLGPDGVAPNMRLLNTTDPTGLVLAYPWDDDLMSVSYSGNQFFGHISASTRDLVVIPSSAAGEWGLWRPAFADVPMVVDLGTNGSVEVESIYDDCYAIAAPLDSGFSVTPVECTATGCATTPALPTSFASGADRIDLAAMPGGGFVVVTSSQGAAQRLEARFFDDAFEPVAVNGAMSYELALAGSVPDLAVAATTDGAAIVVAVVYNTFGAMSATKLVALTLE